MMDVVKSCETSKTSLMVKVQPTPQTQLQWLEISVWCVKCDPWSDPPSMSMSTVHPQNLDLGPRLFCISQPGVGSAAPVTQSAHTRCPGHWQWSVVSNTSEEEQGTSNQLHVDTSLRTPHLSAVDPWDTTRWPRPCQLWRILRQGTL